MIVILVLLSPSDLMLCMISASIQIGDAEVNGPGSQKVLIASANKALRHIGKLGRS